MPTTFQSTLSATSPNSPSTAAAATALGFQTAKAITVIATLQGATGGVLDVYLQTSFDGGTTWHDFAHFPQLAAAAASTTKIWHVARESTQTTLTTVGTGLSPALAANTIVGGCWGDQLRLVFVAGASTTAGAAQSVKIFQWRQ